MLPKAVGYIRTSSAANVGQEKDSEPRQRRAIEAYAKAAGYELVDWFSDPAVSGTDPIQDRPGFAALLDRIEGNGVRVVLIEEQSRFARETVVQEMGVVLLINRGVKLITASGTEMTDDSDPMKTAMRQMVGALVQCEKSRLVAKLKHARDRKREETGKCEGRKSYAESRPEVVALAKQLREQGYTFKQIPDLLAEHGYTTKNNKLFAVSSIQAMLKQ
jgi:DNA invertase Pin-like site-specific DNA recombinase